MRKAWFLALALLASAAAAPASVPTGRTLDGAAFAPGKVTIVHYWATWCAPCRVEMPILDAYYRKHHAQGLNMVAISIDQGASANRLKQMTRKFAFPVARADDMNMARRDIPAAIPVNRVYDSSGRLVLQTRADGKSTIDMATLESVVTPLLQVEQKP
jgi:thiol-disulfide isomerase/thioredoxin